MHQNSFGGLTTIAMSTFTLFLIIQRLIIMFKHEQDQIAVIPMSVEFDDLGEVRLSDMNMLFYFQIKSLNTSTLLKDVPYDDDFSRIAYL